MDGPEPNTVARGAGAIAEFFHRDVSADERKKLEKSGAAMPGGRFPIANAEDLTSAIRLAKTDAERRHVIKRARALELTDKIPDTWNSDGTMKHDALTHYGVKGMKWGVRRTRKQLDAASDDANKAAATKAVIKKNKGSTHALSNNDLKALVERMNLEQNYSRLAAQQAPKSAGKAFVNKLLTDKKTRDKVVGGMELGKAAIGLGRELTNMKL